MAKRRIFGNTFNIWDVVIIIILLGYGVYFYKTNGLEGFGVMIGQVLFYGIVTAWIVSFLLRKSDSIRKPRK